MEKPIDDTRFDKFVGFGNKGNLSVQLLKEFYRQKEILTVDTSGPDGKYLSSDLSYVPAENTNVFTEANIEPKDIEKVYNCLSKLGKEGERALDGLLASDISTPMVLAGNVMQTAELTDPTADLSMVDSPDDHYDEHVATRLLEYVIY
ncbi:hypothetical protein GF323_02155 [Candidatus Woesearchaeota archaeon]|nr:hypothetical protein [Candidatus Woesearchaeota archaeon]